MARALNKLTARTVETLKEAGRHGDGGGLYLVVTKSNSKNWSLLFDFASKRREMGLGSYPEIDLASARIKAADARKLLANGVDPLASRKGSRVAVTFGMFADDYVKTMRSEWRNEKHAAQWTMTLTHYAEPIRGLPVDRIGTEEVLGVLKPLWQRVPETAERLRGRIENVLSAAKAKGLRSGENPAAWRGHLDQLLPKRQRLKRGHHAALPYDQLAAFITDLRERQAIAGLALEFTILTAARSGEVLGARWQEIDTVKAIWTIPADRMKAGKEHRVPLSDRALAIIDAVKPLMKDGKSFIFPGQRGKALSVMAMTMILRRMKRTDITVHGFRSTFRDWASETTGFPHEVCEMALAHTIGNKAEAAYRRGDLFDKRRDLMAAWAAFCEAKPGNVIPMKRGA
jgi:integrase